MGEYETAQLTYWRDRAKRLEMALEEIAGDAQSHVWQNQTPPEPPVGTVLGSWTHSAGGWYCPREGCSNCPCDWSEAYERIEQ